MPNPQHENDEPLVLVAVAPNELIAGMWKSWLEEDGIIPLVKSAGPGQAYFTNFANEHLFYVLESQAEHAREILEQDDENG